MEAFEITLGTILNRKELRKIKGGGSVGPPGTPSGGNIGPFKCCITGTNFCSECVTCTPSCTCGAGATLVAC
ncbi:hypothetical protein SAMN06265348_101192 [Pedobacter westerhofensis]|uniref:Uncharacterized protein n=1 Tax=Pedobacter westerhofensis TaxID=425512 RepID=A0A521AGZ6_9SPHI|nr:hypothetical protein SAMN06265348_101192 [Pedobacter westerhofensis]